MSCSPSRTQRQMVLDAMARRPQDPWPRWQGHVLLGVPGSPRLQKAYHEPGGGFSPSAGSFGVSVLLDAQAHHNRTGDELPMDQISQEFLWPEEHGTPSIKTVTPYYLCDWRLASDDRWICDLTPRSGPLQLLIRSVGPAGGPIERMDWHAGELFINRRWIVTFSPAATGVHLGIEGQKDWLRARSAAKFIHDPEGWAYARIELPNEPMRITIRDTAPWFGSPLTYRSVKSTITMDLPDKAFSASLDAQAANLLMGFIGRQTCPGEPTNYPLAWERDGAYSVIAMARCGQIETAKQLAVYFAENDFFGGFGAEGDAPGSAINVLATVGLISGDRDFQRWCWPHIMRKVALIEEMVAARESIEKPWIGPIVPEHLTKECLPTICKPAQNGLIIGSMDLHYPALYINAMSYLGLRRVMNLAAVIDRRQEILDIPALAKKLQDGWLRNLTSKEHDNERTYMTGLWPSWIATADPVNYRAGLERRWSSEHGQGAYPQRPLWTYFTAAEAHQWLFFDKPEYTWKTLRYFWQNQCSPGLYTYWEGEREENTFHQWEHLRGWVEPKFVTPHYWTAAEMLLLQIDMLAYVNEAAEPGIIIGGGFPQEWRGKPASVAGIPTLCGVVDWRYDGAKQIDVTVRGGDPCRVRAGIGFGADVRIKTNFTSE